VAEVFQPVGKRPYHAFLSHAHVDKTVVDRVYRWFTDVATVRTWYDSVNLPPGSAIASYLPKAIAASRAALIFVSDVSVTRGWVEQEYNLAIGQAAGGARFRLIPVQMDDTPLPGFLANYKSVDLKAGEVTLEAGEDLLAGLYGDVSEASFTAERDVYVSRGWHARDAALADSACRALGRNGWRLVGDSDDQPNWSTDRVGAIIESCGAFVAVLPHRADGPQNTSHYVLRELALAVDLHVPIVVVADPRVDCAGLVQPEAQLVRATDENGIDDVSLLPAVEFLADEWRAPTRPSYVFYATDIDVTSKERNDAVQRVVRALTGMECRVGQYVRDGTTVQQAIVDLLADASVVVANISDDNLNTCIEAGIARATGRQLYLLRKGEPTRPPFMFRDLQVFNYADDAGLIGRVCSLLYRHRRRIISREL
jgi:TIR domain